MGETPTIMANIWTAVSTAVTNLLSCVGNVAETVATTDILLIFAIVLPVVSFGVGLLIRLINRA